jgi:hypothetical protein
MANVAPAQHLAHRIEAKVFAKFANIFEMVGLVEISPDLR